LSENTKKKEAEAIIAKATAAATSSSMLLTFLGDTAGLSAISVSMARHIAQICGKEISVEEALKIINTLAPNTVGRIATQTMLGFIPAIGNLANAAISYGYFERLGWALFNYFCANETPSISSRNVFICYSRKDERFAARLLDHLRCFELEGDIEVFIDKTTKPGNVWKTEIEEALERAKLALVLISPDFLLSNFISTIELPTILCKARRKNAVVFPIIVSPTPRTETVERLLSYQSPMESMEPLSKLQGSRREEAYKQIAEAAVDTLKAG
jgi:uncharacterized protein (DUF697 family)